MRLWIAALAVACAPCAHAETLYVIEQLFVNVSSAPDGTGERVAQIKSGDDVELIERQGDQAHVRLASGDEGWLKASYLSADPPLRQQLAARTEELEKMRREKAQLETELTAARKAPAAADASAKAAGKAVHGAAGSSEPTASPSGVTSSEANAPAADQAAAPGSELPMQPAPPLFEDEPIVPTRPSWIATLGAAVIALVVGFALGWRMLDRRIRAKYGGLRIY